jgi:signal transduction histidine kinase/CheY-like chemotaxis protein
MVSRGMDFMNDPRQIRFSFNQKKIVFDVLSGAADIGMIRTDLMEEMIEKGEIGADDLRVLEPKHVGDDFPFLSSTELVPEWPLARLPHVQHAVWAGVAEALRILDADSEPLKMAKISGWYPSLSYHSLHVINTVLGFSDRSGVCIRSNNLYDAIPCPEGFRKRTREQVAVDCELDDLPCPDGYSCVCRPCEQIPVTSADSTIIFFSIASLVTILLICAGELLRRIYKMRLRRVAADAAAESQESFLGFICHEIRNPLNGAIATLSFLAENSQVLKNGELCQFVDTISCCNFAMLNILNDTLDHTKMARGKIELDEAAYPLVPLLHSVATVFADEKIQLTNDEHQRQNLELDPDFKTTQGDVGIELYIDDAVPDLVFGDQNRMRQVLFNLMSNAVKFTHDGRVELRVEAEADRAIRFSVTDTGIGMLEEEASMLFNEYTQANSTIARRFGGTGLGLSICKKLVELMGGKIAVHSKLNVGSSFFFTIPLTPVEDDVSPDNTIDRGRTPSSMHPRVIGGVVMPPLSTGRSGNNVLQASRRNSLLTNSSSSPVVGTPLNLATGTRLSPLLSNSHDRANAVASKGNGHGSGNNNISITPEDVKLLHHSNGNRSRDSASAYSRESLLATQLQSPLHQQHSKTASSGDLHSAELSAASASSDGPRAEHEIRGFEALQTKTLMNTMTMRRVMKSLSKWRPVHGASGRSIAAIAEAKMKELKPSNEAKLEQDADSAQPGLKCDSHASSSSSASAFDGDELTMSLYGNSPAGSLLQSPSASPRFPPHRELPTAKHRILVVDDSRLNRSILKRILEQAKYDVTLAVNGQECLNATIADDVVFDVILLDIEMPVMSGREAIAKLRANNYTAPVAALTANALLSDRDSLLQSR